MRIQVHLYFRIIKYFMSFIQYYSVPEKVFKNWLFDGQSTIRSPFHFFSHCSDIMEATESFLPKFNGPNFEVILVLEELKRHDYNICLHEIQVTELLVLWFCGYKECLQ